MVYRGLSEHDQENKLRSSDCGHQALKDLDVSLASNRSVHCLALRSRAAPEDAVHRDVKVECGQCHQSKAWRPATFDHNKYFVLDRDHQASCETCHKNNDYSRYTCYGCHEHSQAKVRAEHLE